eukprot:1054821-Prymnesium_polylepis.1
MARAAWVRGCQVASFSFWLGQAGGRGASFVFGGGSGAVVTHAVAMQLLAMRPAHLLIPVRPANTRANT